jgi:type I restriction enzyme S subunit
VKTHSLQLGEVCQFVYGAALKEENRRSGKVPVYGSNGVVGWHDKAITRGATIIIGRKGSIGEVNWSKGPCFPIDTTYYIEKTEKPCDLRWLYYTLLKLDLTRLNKSAAVPGLNRDDAYEQLIPFPDVSEQERIAVLLDRADRLRRTRRHALELIENILPAAFLEVFGDPKANPLGLPVAELGDFMSFVTSGSRGWAEYYSPVGTRFIRSLDVRMNYISHEDAVFVKPPDGAEADRTRVKPGDVLLTITGSRIGRVAPVPERLNGAFISQHVAILRLKAGLLPEFLSMFLSLGPGGQRQIARAQYGQTKPGLNLDQIREMRVPVPDIRHQQRFLELTKRVERLSIVQGAALRQAEHLFASLLERAFSSQPATAQKQSAARP